MDYNLNSLVSQLRLDIVIKKNIKINTYSDHRMAMAFAPLGIISPIIINDPDVISKSFPSFWRLIRKLNFKVTEY